MTALIRLSAAADSSAIAPPYEAPDIASNGLPCARFTMPGRASKSSISFDTSLTSTSCAFMEINPSDLPKPRADQVSTAKPFS